MGVTPEMYARTTEAVNGDKPRQLDLVFTMDCTGSMGSYIQAGKQNIQSIVSKLATQNIDVRFGLVAYRDHPPQDQTYVTKEFGFMTSVDEMQRSLNELGAQGGGDGPEAVEAGLKATLEMAWRPDATKVCILIADAPPHGLGENGDGFPDGAPTGVDPLVVIEQMSARGICIYSVGCQPALSNYRFAVDFMIAAAERTNGQAVALGSAEKLADVIMGGAIEEVGLQGLMAEMQLHAQQLQQQQPALAEEELQEQVFRAMQAQGTKTRQMRAATLSSERSGLVSAAPTLGAAKAALCAAAPPALSPSLASFGARARSRGAAPRCARMDSDDGPCYRAAPPPSPPGAVPAPPSCMASCMAYSAMPMEVPQPAMGMALDDRVELEEAEISMAQVKRMYAKAKKAGTIG